MTGSSPDLSCLSGLYQNGVSTIFGPEFHDFRTGFVPRPGYAHKKLNVTSILNMGTSGWFALLHKGRYYRVHHHYDCYFFSLGRKLEEELKSMDLTTLLNIWRTLLDLAVIEDAMLVPPTEESALSEWNMCMKTLPSSGNISSWFSGHVYDDHHTFDGRHLTEEHDPYLSRGDGCFIEYIYLVDMDNNEFSGLNAPDGEILIFPLDTTALPIFGENWAEHMEQSQAWAYAEAFPLPGCVEGPLMESIAQHGYEVTKLISYSRTAIVYRARCTRNGAPSDVVLKVFFKIGKDSTYMRPMAIADLLLSTSMPHPHIVKIIAKQSFANCPSLVLEAYEGDLADLNVSSPEVKEDYVKAVVQAAAGLAFLHTKGIVHHDIKPKNILYRRDSNGAIEAAICDFESCCVPYIFNARWLELSWGPYEHTKTRVEARIAQDNVSDDSGDDSEFDITIGRNVRIVAAVRTCVPKTTHVGKTHGVQFGGRKGIDITTTITPHTGLLTASRLR
jgi:hypothetical protein